MLSKMQIVVNMVDFTTGEAAKGWRARNWATAGDYQQIKNGRIMVDKYGGAKYGNTNG